MGESLGDTGRVLTHHGFQMWGLEYLLTWISKLTLLQVSERLSQT